MPLHKNALIRYKTIDQCLQNQYRKWTLEDLIEACSEALYEYEGKDTMVSKRTVQLDIQMMRSDKLGYNAPIVVYDRKYYKYEEADYSIKKIPLTENDMQILSETVAMLKQFKDFSLFAELGGIIQRLEDKVYTEQTQETSIIHLDKNENLKGLAFLDQLYQAILKKRVLRIRYQSFSARQPNDFFFYPFILKEYNNRWFLVGKKTKSRELLTLALDRLIKVEEEDSIPYLNERFDGDAYYKNTIGVTVLAERHLQTIVLKVDKRNAPYVLTKPFHASQQVLEQLEDGSVFIQLRLHLNLELERVLLGFGSSIEVIKPRVLRRRMHQHFQWAVALYEPKEEEKVS